MKWIRLFVLMFCLPFAAVALGAESAATLSSRLTGMWMEYSPSSNLVRFERDGGTRLYLKKGEIGNLRALEGTWSVSESGILTVTYTVATKSITLEARLTFEGEEMVLTESDGAQTRHRRHTGPVPEIYLW